MLLEEFDQIVRQLLLAGPGNARGVKADGVDPAMNGLQVGRAGRAVMHAVAERLAADAGIASTLIDVPTGL